MRSEGRRKEGKGILHVQMRWKATVESYTLSGATILEDSVMV